MNRNQMDKTIYLEGSKTNQTIFKELKEEQIKLLVMRYGS